MVERIEHVDSKLQFHRLSNPEVLADREIEITDSGKLKSISPRVCQPTGGLGVLSTECIWLHVRQ